MKISSKSGESFNQTEPVYVELGEHDHVDRGPQIGPDGKYDRPVDVDIHDYVCPTCNRDWPDAPDIFVCSDQNIVWIEGRAIPIRRRLQLSFWEVLIERFGKFIDRSDWISIACSDVPDADIPDHAGTSYIINQIRRHTRSTNVVLQVHRRLGYRLTTKKAALSLRENEQRADIKEKEALHRSKTQHIIAMEGRRRVLRERKKMDNRLRWRFSPKNARNKPNRKKQ